MRLIDVDRLTDDLRMSNSYHARNSRDEALLGRTVRIVFEQPVVDAVHAAGSCYCYECEQYSRSKSLGAIGGRCGLTFHGVYDMDFCSWGERREK